MARYPVPAANDQHRTGVFDGDRGAAHELARVSELGDLSNALQRLLGTPSGRGQRDAPWCLDLCFPNSADIGRIDSDRSGVTPG